MTGKQRVKVHRARARAAVLADRCAVAAEHEANRDALLAARFVKAERGVTAYFRTNERKAARALKLALRSL